MPDVVLVSAGAVIGAAAPFLISAVLNVGRWAKHVIRRARAARAGNEGEGRHA